MTRLTCHAGSRVRAGSAAAGHAILGSALALDGGASVWSWFGIGDPGWIVGSWYLDGAAVISAEATLSW